MGTARVREDRRRRNSSFRLVPFPESPFFISTRPPSWPQRPSPTLGLARQSALALEVHLEPEEWDLPDAVSVIHSDCCSSPPDALKTEDEFPVPNERLFLPLSLLSVLLRYTKPYSTGLE